MVTVGDTLREPDIGTEPMPGVRVALTALVEDQVKVALRPRSMEVGETDSLTVGGGDEPPPPPAPEVSPEVSSARPTGPLKPEVTRSSTPLPSRLARWILAVSRSVQYILPAPRSSARPAGKSKPEVTRSSTPLPSRFARWILALNQSVQYILPAPRSRAMAAGRGARSTLR